MTLESVVPTAPTQRFSSPSGPIDRVSFFVEQRRNRRATWRMTVACGIALLLVGIPLSLVLSPLLYAVVFVLLNTVHLLFPIPEALAALQTVGNLAFTVFGYLAGDAEFQVSLSWIGVGVAVWLIPGILAILFIWFGVYTLFKHVGVGSVIISVGAREPRRDDLEEQQLCNVVEEMALAAGVPPLRVVLLDSPIANAAAIGTTPKDATIIISRCLLDEWDRAQTQGIIGHLIGSIGNGDLRIAFLMSSILLTFGTLVALLRAPFGPHGRAALFKFVRLGLKGWKKEVGATAETELLQMLIAEGLEFEGPDDLDALSQKQLSVIVAPFIFANIAVRWTLFILVPGLINPVLALLWRTRRYLADSTAVQLTRNPDGVARALLAMRGELIPGSQGVAHLFVTGPAGAESISEIFHWEGIGFHPSCARRLRRLRVLGATVTAENALTPSALPQRSVLTYALEILVAVLLPIAAIACLAGMVLFVFVSLFFMGIFLGALHGLFALLALLKGWALA
ncbi:MAG: M48 family metalloprotease [Candidatus Binatia bacterium]